MEKVNSRVKVDMVNSPPHYFAEGRKECIEEMIDKFGLDKVITFCELNEYKYLYRHEMKNGEEDLRKAEWYYNKALKLSQCRHHMMLHETRKLRVVDKKILFYKNTVGRNAYKVSKVWKLGAHVFFNEEDLIFRVCYWRDKSSTRYVQMSIRVRERCDVCNG